jgi:hypothetical protein
MFTHKEYADMHFIYGLFNGTGMAILTDTGSATHITELKLVPFHEQMQQQNDRECDVLGADKQSPYTRVQRIHTENGIP